jgi:hypothetical protein
MTVNDKKVKRFAEAGRCPFQSNILALACMKQKNHKNLSRVTSKPFAFRTQYFQTQVENIAATENLSLKHFSATGRCKNLEAAP